jgi:hypothetical protein
MNRDDIVRMAREVGISKPWDQEPVKWETLERFATLVYERAFIDGMQKQMQSSVDKAVNKMAQREWQGLTDEEALAIGLDAGFRSGSVRFNLIVQTIEAKLKEKNT